MWHLYQVLKSPKNIPSPPAASNFSFRSFHGNDHSDNRYVCMINFVFLCLNVQNCILFQSLQFRLLQILVYLIIIDLLRFFNM